MVTTLHNFWHKHRRIIIIAGFLLIGIFLLPHLAHAQATPATQTPDDVAQNMLGGLSKIVDVLKRIFWPILLMIGGLMQNDILFGSGMESVLNLVWVQIRNIVNILFVLILLGIALSNVIGQGGENYHLKTILPKFIIALIAVNFTFLGAKLVLDSVNVLSTAIFALPDTVQQSLTGQPAGTTPLTTVDAINGMCAGIFGADPGTDAYNANIDAANKPPAGSPPPTANQTICLKTQAGATVDGTPNPYANSYLNPELTGFFSKMNAQNAALVMALNLQNAYKLDKVNVPKSTAGALVVNVLFSIILFVVFGSAYVALFITLLIRLVALWVMIAISPLMVLPSVLPEKIKSMLGEGGDIAKKFVANAMVPIPVALVMSIGYIMLNALQNSTFKPQNAGSVNISGGSTMSVGLYTSGITTLQSLIVALGSVAFIWVGVFQAMHGTYAEGIVGSIKNTVEGAGRALGSFAVKSIPLFPVTTSKGGKETATIGDIGLAMHAIPQVLQQGEREHAEKVFPQLMRNQGQILSGISNSKNKKDFRDNLATAPQSMWKASDFQQSMHKAAEVKDNKDDMRVAFSHAGISGTFDQFMTKLKEGKVEEGDMDKFMNNGMRVTPASGFPQPEGAKGGTPVATAGGLMKRKDEILKKGYLGTDADAKKDFDRLDAAEKILRTSKDPKAKEEAAKVVAEINKKVTDAEDARATIDKPIVDKVNAAFSDHNHGQTGAADDAKAIEADLNAEIKTLVEDPAAPEHGNEPAAKAKVIGLAAQGMSKEHGATLKSAAKDNSPLLSQAIAQKEAATAAALAATPRTGGGARPPSGTATPAGGASAPAAPGGTSSATAPSPATPAQQAQSAMAQALGAHPSPPPTLAAGKDKIPGTASADGFWFWDGSAWLTREQWSAK